MTENAIIVPMETIEQKILLFRGQKVILDSDLAELYGLKAFRLREQVKRNIERFPIDFMFQLSDKEINFMVSHFAIPSRKYFGGHRPYVFTQEGVAMLSSVLRSPRAVQVNIAIMRAFVRLRELLSSHKELARKLEEIEQKYDVQFKIVFEAIRELMTPPPEPEKPPIGFGLKPPKE